MVLEVLKALRNQQGPGVEVIGAEWFRPTTVVPSELMPDDSDSSWMMDLHGMHHGGAAKSAHVEARSLTQLTEHPCAIAQVDSSWNEALIKTFPQAKVLSWVDVLIHDLVQWSRHVPHDGWSIRWDVRKQGAVAVGMVGESLQWVHHLESGFEPDDALYAMVNAMHRCGGDPTQARVKWSGERSLTQGWERFVPIVEGSPEEDGWAPLLKSMASCA